MKSNQCELESNFCRTQRFSGSSWCNKPENPARYIVNIRSGTARSIQRLPEFAVRSFKICVTNPNVLLHKKTAGY